MHRVPPTSYDFTPHIQPVSLPQGRHLPGCASSTPSPHWVCVCSALSLNDRPLDICRASHRRLPQVLLTCHLITKTDFMFSYLKLYHPHMVTFWVLPLPLPAYFYVRSISIMYRVGVLLLSLLLCQPRCLHLQHPCSCCTSGRLSY